MRITNKIVFIFLVFILGVGTILPLFHSGFFTFHDNTQVERVYEMGVALGDKSFPVRWVPDLGYGYGYPIFNFYGPLPYYLGGILSISGFGALLATKIMLAFGVLLSGFSMFYLSKKYFGLGAGVASSVVYMYFPYHAVNIYVRGAVGEFFAYAVLPLVFLGLFQLIELKKAKLISPDNFRTVLLTSLAIFLVATSHNLSIFMLLILLVPFVLLVLFFIQSKRTFLILFVVSVSLGLLLSAFYIVPAFMEMANTNVSSQVGGGANFADHFVCPSQFLDSVWGFGGSTKGCMDGLSFRLGKANILLAILGLIILLHSVYRKKFEEHDKLAFISFVLLICSIFLSLGVSNFVWNNISLMQYIQYPWRFINFIGLFISIIVAYSVFKISKYSEKKGAVLIFSIILLTLFSNLKLFNPQNYTNYSNNYYTSKNHIRFDISKISDEYMPSGFQVPRSRQELPVTKVELIKTTGNIGVLEDRTNYLKASYQTMGDGVVHVNTAYFPGWNAYANGQELPIVPTSKGMNVSIARGEGVFEMKLTQTATEILGNLITVVALFGLLIGIIKTSLYVKNKL